MNLQIYAVFDKKTEEYGTPMFLRTNGEAVRGFSDAVNAKEDNNNLSRHAEDYALYHIGAYNTQTAQITTNGTGRLVEATDVKA